MSSTNSGEYCCPNKKVDGERALDFLIDLSSRNLMVRSDVATKTCINNNAPEKSRVQTLERIVFNEYLSFTVLRV